MSDGIERLPWRARTRSHVVFGVLLLMLSLLATACGAGGNGNSSQATITVAAVGNPQMLDLQKLVPEFEKAHSDIQVKFVILPENQLRQQVTQDVATHSGRFDLSMIGTYEVPLWAKNGWIQNLASYVQKTSSYQPDDLVPGVAKALSYKGRGRGRRAQGQQSEQGYLRNLPPRPSWLGRAARSAGHDRQYLWRQMVRSTMERAADAA